MTIIEAIKSGKPFSNQSMIGAYMWIDELDGAVHRDHIADFRNLMWIRAKETPAPVQWLNWKDLIRDDWFVIEI